MDWLTALLPVALLLSGGLGYLIRRQIEGASVDETLDRSLKALTLREAMEKSGIQNARLNELTETLIGRVERVRSREDTLFTSLAQEDEPVVVTQVEMNFAKRNRAEEAALALDRVNIEFADLLERDDALRLSNAMAAWDILVENHAEIAQSMFRGGSMAPLAYWAERERMTVTRIAELQELIAERREL